MTSSQPKEPPKSLPNPHAGGTLPNPYQLHAHTQAPTVIFDEPAKADSKKTAPHLFHNPHTIKRPQAKGTVAKKPARPMFVKHKAVDSSPPREPPPGIDFYRSTADEDAEIIHAKIERDREANKQTKEKKRMAKKYGQWYPDRSYGPVGFTNLAAYRAQGAHADKINSFRDLLRKMKGNVESNSRDGSSLLIEPQHHPESEYCSPANASSVNDEVNGENAYARLAGLSSTPQEADLPPPPPRSPPTQDAVPPPPPTGPYNHTISAQVTHPPTISESPAPYSHTISSDPVHYSQPVTRKGTIIQPTTNDHDHDERPAKKPKTMSFGARMLQKYGHVEGEGLGKNSDGITTHLEAIQRKDQGRINDDGDHDRGRSAQIFEIRGGQRKAAPEQNKFGKPSRVIVTWGCCDGVDLDADAERNDGGVRQEMGDIFQTKFGNVERIHFNLTVPDRPVYIMFVDALSALNAVNRFDEGYQFQGRKVKAQYYMEEKFQAFIYEH